jgi:cell division septum initiation protein DivIVA
MKQQTVIEYLIEQLPIRMQNYLQKEIEQAKEMEKAQRIKDYNAGYVDAQLNHVNDVENYVYESEYLKSRIDELDNQIKDKQNNIANMLINGELNK